MPQPNVRRSLVAILLVAACGNATPTGPEVQTATPAPTPSAVRVTASDVTLIWPLPTDATQLESMLAATSVGGHGELLPASLYDVPVLDQRDAAVTDPKVDRTRLRVVAARFEPCRNSFGPPSDPSCVNQIRLVLQVLRPGGGGADRTTIAANDGAVLAFYKLTRGELLTFAREIAALGGGASETLGIHPGLAREGLGSAYAKALQAKVLSVVGANRLTKITFFVRTAAREPEWPFGTFNVEGGKLVRKTIPTLSVERQSLEGGALRLAIAPMTSAADSPAALLALMGPARAPAPAERAAYASLLRIQNPTKHNPDTMACAECHAAQRMQEAAEKTLGLRSSEFAADAFASKVVVTPGKIERENFHLAGYLGTNLAIGTRTAHDTHAVLGMMRVLLDE